MRDAFGIRLLYERRFQVLALGVATLTVLVFRAIQFVGWTGAIQWGYDFSFYWMAARHILDGEPIYAATQLAGPYVPQAQEGFLYPPPLAALVTPLAAIFSTDYRLAQWPWFAAEAVVLVASVLALVRVERLGEHHALLRGDGKWWLVAAAFAFPPVVDELVLGNVHLFLLGLFTVGWIGLRQAGSPSRVATGSRLAGLAIGAATIVKVFPGFVIVWLVLTRRFLAAGWSVVAIALLVVLTLPITGVQAWQDYPIVLFNLSATPAASDALAPTFWLAPFLGFTLARVLVTGLGLALLVLLALRRVELRLSYAVAVTISILVTPALYASYLSILVLPLILGLVAGVRLRWLALAYLLMWGGQQPALGDLAWIVNRAMPTAGAFVLLGALVARALTNRASSQWTPVAPDPPEAYGAVTR
jgi:alpha-1,2-mannosyltransferase